MCCIFSIITITRLTTTPHTVPSAICLLLLRRPVSPMSSTLRHIPHTCVH